MCHAEIWSLFGLKKEVSITLIQLSKASRAFIISQEGLKGFCLQLHESDASFNYYWKTIIAPVVNLLSDLLPEDLQYRKEHMIIFFRVEDREKLCSDLVDLKTFEKERYLRYEHPTIYQDLLWFSGRESELAKIWPRYEDVTPFNYSWYIQAEILSRLNYWRARGGLK